MGGGQDPTYHAMAHAAFAHPPASPLRAPLPVVMSDAPSFVPAPGGEAPNSAPSELPCSCCCDACSYCTTDCGSSRCCGRPTCCASPECCSAQCCATGCPRCCCNPLVGLVLTMLAGAVLVWLMLLLAVVLPSLVVIPFYRNNLEKVYVGAFRRFDSGHSQFLTNRDILGELEAFQSLRAFLLLALTASTAFLLLVPLRLWKERKGKAASRRLRIASNVLSLVTPLCAVLAIVVTAVLRTRLTAAELLGPVGGQAGSAWFGDAFKLLCTALALSVVTAVLHFVEPAVKRRADAARDAQLYAEAAAVPDVAVPVVFQAAPLIAPTPEYAYDTTSISASALLPSARYVPLRLPLMRDFVPGERK